MSLKHPLDNVVDALRHAAANTTEGVVVYQPQPNGQDSTPVTITYKSLLEKAEKNASILKQFQLAKPSTIVLLHFDGILDTIEWYWAVLLFGATPSVTGPGMFNSSPSDQQKHLKHLHRTLEAPVCLTRRSLLGPFQAQDGEQAIRAIALETMEGKLTSNGVNGVDGINGHAPAVPEVAAVMLTSGSSGSAKAVPLTHVQMLAAFRGKALMANLEYPKSPFLSWVHMDHVANLVHCHIFAIVNGVSQIHVPPAEILADPVRLLNLISRHQVSRTFAPNFLVAKLRRQLEAGKVQGLDADLNLKTLYLDTGGEANVTEVCVAVQKLLSKYGAPRNLFKPSFGMTETCAGCIVNNNCPSYDDGELSEFASLGKPMPGMSLRISRLDNTGEADAGERGSLELKGDVIFKGYLNNEHANATSFTKDGWFVTGDLGYLDRHGNLHLDGRTKEMVNINGVKYLPHELDAALEQADIEDATPTYFCCFGTRAAGMDTEAVAVLYLPAFEAEDEEARSKVQGSIIRVINMHTRSRPIVVPLTIEDMPKSTIGKLSRAKLKKSLEAGEFAAHQERNDTAIRNHRQKTRGEPASDEERQILCIIREQLELPPENDFAVNDAVLSMGATSMDLVAIMQKVNLQLHLATPLKLTDMLNYSTGRQLANRIRVTALQDKHEYDPVVTLQPHGNKTPLFLVHPGVGEVLVFVNLSHHITDRPIYAFRAKGFNASEGETPFQSLDEVFTTYKNAIRARQPRGPYAIAGYSFGGMVAFEIAKRLESEGEEVKYCGSWNLPPHIKFRMRELLWDECVIHLFYFVGLFTEEQAYTHKATLCEFEKQGRRLEAIQYLHKHADQARWEELGLSEEYYLLWVGLASNMQGMAVDYDPSGSVKQMDVFVADPLSHVAKNREDWINNRLAAWNDFVRSEVKFHHVKGAHYTMLNPEYVVSFAETLRKVLRERGL